MDIDGTMVKKPIRIIDRRMVKKGHHAVTEVLVEWVNAFPKYATSEFLTNLQRRYLAFDPWGQGSSLHESICYEIVFLL